MWTAAEEMVQLRNQGLAGGGWAVRAWRVVQARACRTVENELALVAVYCEDTLDAEDVLAWSGLGLELGLGLGLGLG